MCVGKRADKGVIARDILKFLTNINIQTLLFYTSNCWYNVKWNNWMHLVIDLNCDHHYDRHKIGSLGFLIYWEPNILKTYCNNNKNEISYF